jgi:hypothetical protein
MITPTKGIAPQRALLSIGAQIALILDQPLTVSQAWSMFRKWRQDHGHSQPIPFWWFALGLDLLFALDLVEFRGDVLSLRRVDAEATVR